MPRHPSSQGRSASQRTPRREQPAHGKQPSHGNAWIGANFYCQIERCAGVTEHTCSVRLDEQLYAAKSDALKDGIDSFFEGRLEVVVIDVPTLYACEVRIMPDQLHPRHGRKVFALEATSSGAHTIFSKTESKKWPKLSEVCLQLQDFTRIPVTIQLLTDEQMEGSGKDGSMPNQVQTAMNFRYKEGEVDPDLRLAPLAYTSLRVLHSSGKEYDLKTNADGQAETVLHPGYFELRSEEGGKYDRLKPNSIAVPACYQELEFRVVAQMKKQCVFQVVDHMNRPFPGFCLKLASRDASGPAITLMTKANGRARGRVGVGKHVVSYGSSKDPSDWPISQLSQELEVQEMDVQQLFRIVVHRVRFPCEIVLRTKCDEPVKQCPFTVRLWQNRIPKLLAQGVTSELGVATCELPAGDLQFSLDASQLSPFVATTFALQVNHQGDFLPLNFEVETKTADVEFRVVTPDGEPAPLCQFTLQPRFNQAGSRSSEVALCTNQSGIAMGTLCLLEPYTFRVKSTGKGGEYMPQEFAFITDRRALTVVVARTVFNVIPEDNIVFLVDTSGSMQVYMQDVISALNLTIVQQLHESTKHFNVVTYTESQVDFRQELVEASPQNIEDAMRFCESIKAGGGSNIAAALRRVFRFKKAQAVYLITDGKCEIHEELLTHLKIFFLGHPLRPKLHTIGINCVPGRVTHRALQAVAELTQGTFRAVCLEQDHFDALPKERCHGHKLQSPLAPTSDEDSGPADSEFGHDTGVESS